VDDPGTVGRRGFLKAGAAAAAATAAACGGTSSRWRSLTEAEARTLAAACDQIVPPDQDPGASQAGAVDFIDRQLATRRRKDRSQWRAGIAGLDAAARRRHGRDFADLAFDAQAALLQDVEKGSVEKADWPGVEPAAFFRLLRDHTMMGFYGDPRHGGNRDRVSWRMLGVPDPPVRGRLHETPPPSSRRG
jgi:gluconate 2-dehydrogenase gamma chain